MTTIAPTLIAPFGRRRSALAAASLAALVAFDNVAARADDGALPAAHEAGQLAPGRALELAFGLNPSYQAVLTSARRAAVVRAGEAGRFTPTLTAGLDYQRATTTSLNQQGVLQGASDSVNGQVGINRAFPWGMSVAADLSMSIDRREFVSPIVNDPIEIGPGYGINLRVTVVQSLMRGFGEDIGLAQQELAEIAADAAALATRRAASELARDTLNAYWELWYARRAVAIQQEALVVARRNRDDAMARVRAGDAGELTLVTIDTDIANLEEALLAAQSDVRRRRVALGRLIGWPAGGIDALEAAAEPPPPSPAPPRDAMVSAAAANTPELAELRAAQARAEVELRLASDRSRPRLDATAWLALNGLGDKDPLAALSMWAGFEAVTFFVGLDFELPIDRTFLESEAGARRLALEETRQQLERQRQQLEATALDLQENWSIASERLAFARRTVELAERAVTAQKLRLDAGAGTIVEYLLAEQEARRARLRVERLTADVAVAATAGRHVMGTLLTETMVEEAERATR